MRNDEFTRERDDRTPNNGRNGRSAGSARDWQQDRDDNREPRALRDRSDDHSYGQDGDESRREHPVGYSGQGYAGGMANYAHPESRGYGPDPSTHRDFQGQDSYRGGTTTRDFQGQDSYRGGATTRDSQGQSFNQDRFGAPNRGYQGNYDQDRLGRNYQTQGNYSQGNQGFNQGFDRGQDPSRFGYNQASQPSYGQSSQGNYYGQGQYGQGQYGQGQYGQSSQGQYGQSSQGQYGQGQSSQGQYGQGQRGDQASHGAGYQGNSHGYGQTQGESRGRHFGRGPKGYSRSDERLTEDLNERLTQHPDIDASEIEVNVRNGEVTLTGTVDDRQTKRMIEDLAEEVSGVREVHNQIRVQRGDSRQTSASSTASSTASGSRTPSPTATNADSTQSTTRSAGAKA